MLKRGKKRVVKKERRACHWLAYCFVKGERKASHFWEEQKKNKKKRGEVGFCLKKGSVEGSKEKRGERVALVFSAVSLPFLSLLVFMLCPPCSLRLLSPCCTHEFERSC